MTNLTLVGNLTNTPDPARQAGGSKVVTIRVASNTGFGQNKRTMYIDCDLWGDRFDGVVQYLQTGKKVFIAGELLQDDWTDKETGAKRSKHKVRVSNLQLMSDGAGGGKGQSPGVVDGDEDEGAGPVDPPPATKPAAGKARPAAKAPAKRAGSPPRGGELDDSGDDGAGGDIPF
jgi:single-strand DNA-binding protein